MDKLLLRLGPEAWLAQVEEGGLYQVNLPLFLVCTLNLAFNRIDMYFMDTLFWMILVFGTGLWIACQFGMGSVCLILCFFMLAFLGFIWLIENKNESTDKKE